MTGKLAGNIMKTGFLTGAEAHLLIALACVADKYGQSWYSYIGLAHFSRLSRNTAIKKARLLEMKELLHINREKNVQSYSGHYVGATNLFTLNLSFFEALFEICDLVRSATPGNADHRWRAVQGASEWAAEQVNHFRWQVVVQIAQEHPDFVKRVLRGIEDPTRIPPLYQQRSDENVFGSDPYKWPPE